VLHRRLECFPRSRRPSIKSGVVIIGIGGRYPGVGRLPGATGVTPLPSVHFYDPNRERGAVMCKDIGSRSRISSKCLDRKDIVLGRARHSRFRHARKPAWPAKQAKMSTVEKSCPPPSRECRFAWSRPQVQAHRGRWSRRNVYLGLWRPRLQSRW